jgi:hypothetical protein
MGKLGMFGNNKLSISKISHNGRFYNIKIQGLTHISKVKGYC